MLVGEFKDCKMSLIKIIERERERERERDYTYKLEQSHLEMPKKKKKKHFASPKLLYALENPYIYIARLYLMS